MKKFKFNLKALLELREWEEKIARQVFSQSIQEIANLNDKTRVLEAERDSICGDWNESRSRSFSRNDRLNLNRFIATKSQTSSELQAALISAREKRDKALSNMKIAIRKKNVVADMKQRRLEEYQADILYREMVEIEDIYNARSIERKGL